MKISVLFFVCLLIIPTSLFAQDDEIAWNIEDNKEVIYTPDEDVVWVFDDAEEEVVVEKTIEKKGPFRVPDRKFEVGFLNSSFGFSNDYMTTFEIFREKILIDLDKLSGGLNVNANAALSPIYFNFNNNLWGFGFSAGFDLFGAASLNGNMLSLHEANASESDAGAAAFTELKFNGFFTFEKFKIKVKPALYYPLLYAKPDKFSYTYKNINTNGVDETYLIMELDMRVYTAYPIEDEFEISDISGNIDKFSSKPGFDISIGAEYPLSETLGLTEKYDFLDFDVGIDFINIPLYPSEMEDYVRMIVNAGSDKPIDFFSGMFDEDSEEKDIEDYYSYKIDDYGKDKRKVLRPFKMLISANWRPFNSPFNADSERSSKIKREWLTFTPIFGFAVNPLYFQQVSFEGGIKTRFSLVNFFIATLGLGYYDRLWKNSIDFALNFRVFEVDLGASIQSSDFIKCWSGGGFGVTFGLKFGW